MTVPEFEGFRLPAENAVPDLNVLTGAKGAAEHTTVDQIFAALEASGHRAYDVSRGREGELPEEDERERA